MKLVGYKVHFHLVSSSEGSDDIGSGNILGNIRKLKHKKRRKQSALPLGVQLRGIKMIVG